MNNSDYNLMAAQPAVVRVVNNILDHALLNSITDIHLEPDDHNLLISYRQYGELSEPAIIPRDLAAGVFAHLKNLAGINTESKVEKTISGSFKTKRLGQNTLFKASLLPVKQGEKFIIQVLPIKHKLFNLHELGLNDENLFTIQRYLDKKTGIILIAGPDNSGTTATAYSLLSQLNLPNLNICTLEDPIEHNFKHINQVAINRRKGLGFEAGWNVLKNQDADIIYLGNLDPSISSSDLAAIGTGKLIIADITTNDSVSALAEFLNMQENKNLTAESLGLIIHQRLAKQICPYCKTEHILTKSDLRRLQEKFDLDDTEQINSFTFYKGSGCAKCNHTGYLGQIAVFEVIEIDDELTESLIKHGLNYQTKKILEEKTSISEDAFNKALKGLISIEELIRI
ncbi:MAG: ATPase, T2SS/T4P/T4SS family, partial [bacterium]